MALYRLLTAAFIAPNRYAEGTIVNFTGVPGPHMEPLDDDARKALAAYYKKNPDATLNPLGSFGASAPGDAATAEVVTAAPAPAVVDLGNLANPGKAAPGPTEVLGKIAEDAAAQTVS